MILNKCQSEEKLVELLCKKFFTFSIYIMFSYLSCRSIKWFDMDGFNDYEGQFVMFKCNIITIIIEWVACN